MDYPNFALLFYTDPGSGALLLQMLMALAFGALFYFRSFRAKIVALFKRNSKDEEKPAAPDVDSGNQTDGQLK